MSKELIISTGRHETRVAITEDDQLVEIYFQRANEYSLAGSIHKGRVTRVLPGMQSAFVDLGLERDTFLYVSDFFEENEEYEPMREGGREPVEQRETRSRDGGRGGESRGGEGRGGRGRGGRDRRPGGDREWRDTNIVPATAVEVAINPVETVAVASPAAVRNGAAVPEDGSEDRRGNRRRRRD